MFFQVIDATSISAEDRFYRVYTDSTGKTSIKTLVKYEHNDEPAWGGMMMNRQESLDVAEKILHGQFRASPVATREVIKNLYRLISVRIERRS